MSADAYNIHDAKTNLSRLIDRVEHGEEIIISRAGTPVAMWLTDARELSDDLKQRLDDEPAVYLSSATV